MHFLLKCSNFKFPIANILPSTPYSICICAGKHMVIHCFMILNSHGGDLQLFLLQARIFGVTGTPVNLSKYTPEVDGK